MNVAIMHPEGNINFNPSLIALASFMAERGDQVDVWCQKWPIPQTDPGPRINLVFYMRRFLRVAQVLEHVWLAKFLVRWRFFQLKRPLPQLVIGVDHKGVIDAAVMARALNIPSVLISYEIMFAEETPPKFKDAECQACQGIAFAVCQGGERTESLCRENDINPDAVVNMPVSPRGAIAVSRTKHLHQQLGIDEAARIVICAGSLDEWTMVGDIIAAANSWPDPWVLVVHGRYGIDDWAVRKLSEGANSSKVFFSRQSQASFSQFSEILFSCDFGIAFYRADNSSPWTGKNLEKIGLSSGKIACYLQHGLPVIVGEIGEYADLIRGSGAGLVLKGATEIGQKLSEIDDSHLMVMGHQARRLFSERIDADLYKSVFLNAVDRAASSVTE